MSPEISENNPAFTTLPVNIVLPVVLTILLFILTIYLIMIPLIEKNMMETKRQGIQLLTQSAWSALDTFYHQAEEGTLSQKEAQHRAIEHLSRVRYGPEQADYFWINDMTPTMIMHPYRKDLENKDVSGFKDPAGKHLFAEMVATVERNEAGFVDYLWQWKDHPEKIVPKISYVKAFRPWGWVIGTGIYVEDVGQEIKAITHRVTITCSIILCVFLLLSGYIIWQGAKNKKAQIAAMEQARLKEKQLVQADKMTSLGILVAGVAHEVNNPITSIMLNAPNLKKIWAEFEPVIEGHFKDKPDAMVCNMPYEQAGQRVKLMLNSIEDGAARVKDIITELKDFSRPAGAGVTEPIDVNRMVEKSLDLTHSLLKKSTHYLFVSLDDKLPQITGNQQKLQQVVINLIVNACQALESTDQAIHVKTLFLKKSDQVRIVVSDTGPGMPAEQLSKMKDPFFTTKRDEGGTGLGLSICEKIANDHYGALDFESSPGHGMTATLTLPVFPHEEKTNEV